MKLISSLIILTLALSSSLIPTSNASAQEPSNVAKIAFNTTTFDAYGFQVKTSPDTIVYIYRQGTSAGGKGEIVKRTYTISTDSWGGFSHVYKDDTYDSRNCGGGIIGNRVFAFFTRCDYNAGLIYDVGYVYSANLSCTSWSDYIPVELPFKGGSFHGSLISTTNSTTFLQTYYGWSDNFTIFNVGVVKTVNNGDNWTQGAIVYRGAEMWCEPSATHVTNGKMVMLLRNNAGGYLGQTISKNNGDNWTNIVNTNLGISVGKKVPHIIYDSASDNVIAIYQDRGDYKLKISETSANISYNTANWSKSIVISSAPLYGAIGYPSATKISESIYFILYVARAGKPMDADTWQCIYDTRLPTTTVIVTPPTPPASYSSGGDGGGFVYAREARGIPLQITATSGEKFRVRMNIDGRIVQRLLTPDEVKALLRIYTIDLESFIEKYTISEKAALETATRYDDDHDASEFSTLSSIEKDNLELLVIWMKKKAK